MTVEAGDVLQLQWSIGGEVGLVTSVNFSPGFSQIVVTRYCSIPSGRHSMNNYYVDVKLILRHGSQFQLRYGVTLAALSSGETGGALSNGSVLFRVSQRTAFLLGGWPEGAQVNPAIMQ